MIKIYEVMAIEHNLPLFFLDHIKRFRFSINQYKQYSVKELLDIIKPLISPLLEDSDGFNIKVTYCVEDNQFSLTKTVPRKPTKESYITGDKVGIYHGERNNPLIKQENIKFRELTEAICKEKGFYDLLLMNKEGKITEGSRSNFLLVDKEDRVITSPIGDALNGITRSIIFDICKDKNITIIEEEITIEILEASISLIITGTSPEILPISNCESKVFNVNNRVISTLKQEFIKRKNLDRVITKEIFYK